MNISERFKGEMPPTEDGKAPHMKSRSSDSEWVKLTSEQNKSEIVSFFSGDTLFYILCSLLFWGDIVQGDKLSYSY